MRKRVKTARRGTVAARKSNTGRARKPTPRLMEEGLFDDASDVSRRAKYDHMRRESESADTRFETLGKLAKAAGVDLDKLRAQGAKQLTEAAKHANRAMRAMKERQIELRKLRPSLRDRFGNPVHLERK